MRFSMRLYLAALLGFSWINAGAAQRPVDEALTRQIEAERTAHLTYDAESLVGMMTDDFTLVDSGEVMRPARAQSLARFRQYFESVVFRAWDDIAPPVILASADGTLATVLVTKIVRTVRRVEAADPQARVTEGRFAWLETWRREPAGWRLAQLASTRAPADQSVSPARRQLSSSSAAGASPSRLDLRTGTESRHLRPGCRAAMASPSHARALLTPASAKRTPVNSSIPLVS